MIFVLCANELMLVNQLVRARARILTSEIESSTVGGFWRAYETSSLVNFHFFTERFLLLMFGRPTTTDMPRWSENGSLVVEGNIFLFSWRTKHRSRHDSVSWPSEFTPKRVGEFIICVKLLSEHQVSNLLRDTEFADQSTLQSPRIKEFFVQRVENQSKKSWR